MENKAKSIKMVDIDALIENPKNNNNHPPEQIERLSKIIKTQGFRSPLTVSNRSGFVLCGHGRIAAAKSLGMVELPVIYQDFENEAQEYAHLTADNEIARWANIDVDKLKTEVENLEIDTDLLGLDFELNFDTLDYSLLDDDEVEGELSEKESTLRKSIQISFTIENYEEALSLVSFWKEREADIGLLFLEKLRTEKANLES